MKAWQKKEKSDAKFFDGKRVKGSGNTWNNPGDVKSPLFLVDSKDTKNKSFSVTLDIWDKLYGEALFSFRIPILSLKIQEQELMVIAKDDFERILEHTDLEKIKMS